jgi:hypothetical protein
MSYLTNANENEFKRLRTMAVKEILDDEEFWDA